MNTPVLENNLVRRYLLTNNTDFLVYANLTLYPKAEKPANLFRVPNALSVCVRPRSSSQILAYTKIFADQNWEEMNYDLNFQFVENKVQQYPSSAYDRGYGYKDEDNYGRNIPAAPRLNLKLENAGDSEYGPSGYSTMKSCRYCSSLNDINNGRCRVCQRDL